jgi:hypothetical protein
VGIADLMMGTLALPGFKLGKPCLNFSPRIFSPPTYLDPGVRTTVGTANKGDPDSVAYSCRRQVGGSSPHLVPADERPFDGTAPHPSTTSPIPGSITGADQDDVRSANRYPSRAGYQRFVFCAVVLQDVCECGYGRLTQLIKEQGDSASRLLHLSCR